MSFLQFYRDQHTDLPLVTNDSNCKDKTFIVTGANTGLGFEAAAHLVRCHAARVIIAVRSKSKGEEARARIEESTGVKGVAEVWLVDLASFDSVKQFAQKITTLTRVDAIIENASLALPQHSLAEGLETTLTVNVVSTFLLAVLVLPKLRETAAKTGAKTHLTVVGSNSAFWATGSLEKIKGDILDQVSQDTASMKDRYPVSKLLQLYAVRHLATLYPSSSGVIIDYVNPGVCVTDLARNAPLSFKVQLYIMRKILGRTAEIGSRTLLHGAFAGEECHGKYLSECANKEHYIPESMSNETGSAIQQRVWESVAKKLNLIQPGCI